MIDVKNSRIKEELDISKMSRLQGKEYKDFALDKVEQGMDPDLLFLKLSPKDSQVETILSSSDDSLMEAVTMDELMGQELPDSLINLVEDLFK